MRVQERVNVLNLQISSFGYRLNEIRLQSTIYNSVSRPCYQIYLTFILYIHIYRKKLSQQYKTGMCV